LSVDNQKSVLKALLREDGSLVALGFVVDHFEKYKILSKILDDDLKGFKQEVTNKYIRECILPKEAPSEWTLKEISQNLLSNVISSDGFKTLVLPACQKAMLRSPETSMHVSEHNIKTNICTSMIKLFLLASRPNPVGTEL
jgi:hypothetical protein